jgi:hypothetical protein
MEIDKFSKKAKKFKEELDESRRSNLEYTEKLKILLQKDTIANIENILDDLIQKAIDNYVIFTVGFDPEKYYNSKEADIIMKYVKETIMLNMTPAVRESLGLIYIVDTDKQLSDLLDVKIKIHVIAFLNNKNKSIQ